MLSEIRPRENVQIRGAWGKFHVRVRNAQIAPLGGRGAPEVNFVATCERLSGDHVGRSRRLKKKKHKQLQRSNPDVHSSETLRLFLCLHCGRPETRPSASGAAEFDPVLAQTVSDR